MSNKGFFEMSKYGCDVDVVLYDKDLKPIYGRAYTTSQKPTVRSTIVGAISAYKSASGYNMRKKGDKHKYEPKYCYIFTSPAFNHGIFTLNGRNLSDKIDVNKLDDNYPRWVRY